MGAAYDVGCKVLVTRRLSGLQEQHVNFETSDSAVAGSSRSPMPRAGHRLYSRHPFNHTTATTPLSIVMRYLTIRS